MLRINLIRIAVLSLALGGIGLPTEAAAQTQARERTFSVSAGGFNYDFERDGTSPTVALRTDVRLSRILLAELGASYTRADVDIVDYTPPDPVSREGTASLGTLTVGLQAELPVRGVRPYVGIATGLFGRVDHGEGGDSFVRGTTAFPLGVRVPLSERLAARGEVRLRLDEHQEGGSSSNTELTVGLGWRLGG